MNYYLNIGSNLGDRRRNISRAVSLISSAFGTQVQCSAPVESRPWGFETANSFVNEGIVLHTDRQPQEVLEQLQRVERAISPASHRNPDGSYRDRLIDIDIVAIDQLTIDTPSLTVPHPHLPEREFYILPLCELAPQWHHPRSHLTPKEMLQELQRAGSIA